MRIAFATSTKMDGPEPVKQMAKALKDNKHEPMEERLLHALEAGKAAGGPNGLRTVWPGAIPKSMRPGAR